MEKKIKPKKCKGCGEKYTPERPLQQVCGFACAIQLKKKQEILKAQKEPKVYIEKKQRKNISKVSKKRKAQNVLYLHKKKQFLDKNPFCQKRLPGCLYNACDIHHLKGGKDRSKTFLDESTWMGVCRSCHILIHDKNI